MGFLALDGNADFRLSSLDHVPVVQINPLDLVVIDQRAVTAVHVHQATKRRIHFDKEMRAGEVPIVLPQPKVRMIPASHNKRVVTVKLELPSLVGSFGDCQHDAHRNPKICSRADREMNDGIERRNAGCANVPDIVGTSASYPACPSRRQNCPKSHDDTKLLDPRNRNILFTRARRRYFGTYVSLEVSGSESRLVGHRATRTGAQGMGVHRAVGVFSRPLRHRRDRIMSRLLFPSGGLLSRWLMSGLAACLALLSIAGTAAAQVPRIPSIEYLAAYGPLYNGEHVDSLKAFRSAAKGALRGANGLWIDSIPYESMIGESLYRMGEYEQALMHFENAINLHLAYNDWLLRVQWTTVVRPSQRRPSRYINWAQTKRKINMGHYPETMGITLGGIRKLPNGQAFSNQKIISIDVVDILRGLAHSIRRCGDILGPVAYKDQVLQRLNVDLQRRRVPPNHWSNAWMDVLQGLTFAAVRDGNAVPFLKRGLLVSGQWEHPFTSHILLELGHNSLSEADFKQAAQFYREATLSAAMFLESTRPGAPLIMEEAFRYGAIAHMLSGDKNVYPDIFTRDGAIRYARREGLRHMETSLHLLQAENWAHLNDTKKAVATLRTARAIGTRPGADMMSHKIGARYNHISALTSYQQGRVAEGDASIALALNFLKSGHSRWLTQIDIADRKLLGNITRRESMDIYKNLLREPLRSDWLVNPLETLCYLTTPNVIGPMENWFALAMLDENNVEPGFEIADQIRRHRFYNSLGFGGRLLNLRWLLNAPDELLDQQALNERGEILLMYPDYANLAKQVSGLRDELSRMPLVPGGRRSNQAAARETRAGGTSQRGAGGRIAPDGRSPASRAADVPNQADVQGYSAGAPRGRRDAGVLRRP